MPHKPLSPNEVTKEDRFVTFQMWWMWMAFAAIFIVGEALRQGSFFLWLGFGAAVSGILALLGIPSLGQIVVFINISGILIVLERRFSERYAFKKPVPPVGVPVESSPLDGLSMSNDEEQAQYVIRKTGTGWEIAYGGKSHAIKQSVGLFHIRNLILKPGEWIHCSELKRLSSEGLSDPKYHPYSRMTKDQLEAESLHVIGDHSTEDIIKQLPFEKIKMLKDALVERRESDNFDSPEDKIDQLKALEFIESHLNSITDNRGRPRKINDQADTDRKAVSAAINRCRNNLQEHRDLYTHLNSFIQAKGNAFRYLPDRPIEWKTD